MIFPLKPDSKQETPMKNQTEANKQNAINFYKTAYNGNPKLAIEKYVGDRYIQHNPLVEDGKDGFISYFTKMSTDYPNKRIEFVRSIAEGDMFALHTKQTWPDDIEYATMDFFRFDTNGKIIEHWDSIQEVPKTAKNKNTMF
jgi:predicted SnoaL-like aldol condensation-catalyzing enzyme